MLSEAVHSGLDLLSSIVTFFVIRASDKPADDDHPFGHGKIESISALFEAFLLIVAGLYIAYESLSHGMSGTHNVVNTHWGLIVLGASVLINLFVYFQNRKVAHQNESIAIETNSFHFLTDVFSSLGVFLSLFIIRLTGWIWVDLVAALGIGTYVFVIGLQQIKKCVLELSDTALPEEEVKQVSEVLQKHNNEFLGYHELKTRKVGPTRFIEFHLTTCSEQKVGASHQVCDVIEDDLLKLFKETQVNIHVEPCGNHDDEVCDKVCRFYQKPIGKI